MLIAFPLPTGRAPAGVSPSPPPPPPPPPPHAEVTTNTNVQKLYDSGASLVIMEMDLSVRLPQG